MNQIASGKRNIEDYTLKGGCDPRRERLFGGVVTNTSDCKSNVRPSARPKAPRAKAGFKKWIKCDIVVF